MAGTKKPARRQVFVVELNNGAESGGTAEGDVGKLGLGFVEALAFALFLPVVDHLSGLVEDLNPLVVSDPALALQLGLQAFPGILTGPEEVGGEGAGATANDLINRKGYVVGKQRIFSRNRPSSALGV